MNTGRMVFGSCVLTRSIFVYRVFVQSRFKNNYFANLFCSAIYGEGLANHHSGGVQLERCIVVAGEVVVAVGVVVVGLGVVVATVH